MKRGQSGFSLFELVVAMGIFSIVSVLVFSFFRYGTRAFHQAAAKHGLQTEALRIAESLQKELKRTNESTVDIVHDSRALSLDGQTVHRDVICFATLKNWHDRLNTNNFDLESRAPLWNRYMVYYATMEPKGRLIKLRVDPAPPPEAPTRLGTTDLSRLYYDNPQANRYAGSMPSYSVLSPNVQDFDIARSSSSPGAFDISLKLKQKHPKGSVEPGARREFDFYELQLTVRPENSFP